MASIAPLMAGRNYRGLTHAMVLMNGIPWTPDAELATGLDFAIGAKLVGTGENLTARATFLFDAPAANNGPYRKSGWIWLRRRLKGSERRTGNHAGRCSRPEDREIMG